MYGVPRTTISDVKLGKRSSNIIGRKTKLDPKIEKILCDACVKLSDIGLGLTKTDILAIIKQCCQTVDDCKNIFPPSGPTEKWYNGFMKRWKHVLSKRMASHLSYNRAKAVTKEKAQQFYQLIKSKKESLELEYGPIPATDYWNTDETGFSGSQGDTIIVCRRGSKNPVTLVGNNEKVYYTVNFAGSAAGEYMPPYTIYKGSTSTNKWITAWSDGGPTGAYYNTSKSGWMEEDNFIDWFKEFIKYVRHTLKLVGPIILFLDGYYSHLVIIVIDLAIENNIHLI